MIIECKSVSKQFPGRLAVDGLVRQTNLEDVFLELTGSRLEIGGPDVLEWEP